MRSTVNYDPRLEHDRTVTTKDCCTAVASLANIASNTSLRHLWSIGETTPDVAVEVEVQTTPSLHDEATALIMSRKAVPEAVFQQKLTPELVTFIETETVQQTKSKLWHDLHRGRITSSLFGSVYHATSSPSLINRIVDNRLI